MHWLWAKLDTYGVLVILPEYKLPSGLQKSQAVHRILFCFFSFQWKRMHFNCMKQFYNLYYRNKVSLYKLKIQICKIRHTSEKHNLICCIILSNNICFLKGVVGSAGICTLQRHHMLYIVMFVVKKQLLSACYKKLRLMYKLWTKLRFCWHAVYVYYEAIRLLRTSILFSMQKFQAFHIFWLFINHTVNVMKS